MRKKDLTKRMDSTKKNIIEIIKFGFIGILNTVLDWFLFWAFLSLLGLDKNVAQILATALAMTNSYFLNRYWTFKKTGAVKVSEMGKFIIVNLVSLGVNLLCLNLFCDVFKLQNIANEFLYAVKINYELTGDMAVMFCKLCAVPFSLAVNFLGNKLWVFRKKDR